MVLSWGLPVGASLPYIQGGWGEAGCAKRLLGGIVPFLLVLQQDSNVGCMVLATGFLSGGNNWCPDTLGFREAERLAALLKLSVRKSSHGDVQ